MTLLWKDGETWLGCCAFFCADISFKGGLFYEHSGIIHTFSDMLKVEGIVNPINAQIKIKKQCNKPYLDLRQWIWSIHMGELISKGGKNQPYLYRVEKLI